MNLPDNLSRLLARVRAAPFDWLTLRVMRRLPLTAPARSRSCAKVATTATPAEDDHPA